MATPVNNSVRKAFEILFALAEQRHGLTAKRVADLTGMNAATAHRFLISLESVGAVTRPDGNLYQMGALMAELGSGVKKHRILDDAVKPNVSALVKRTRESVQVGILSGARALLLRSSQSDRTLQMTARTSNLMPLHCTSLGKVLLAGMSPSELNRLVGDLSLDEFTCETITDNDRLLKEVEKIKLQGYGVSDEEWEIGLRSIAVPVMSSNSKVVAAISISGPTSRMSDSVMQEYLVDLKEQAAQIQRKIYSESLVVEGKAAPRGNFPHVKKTGNFIFVSGISSRKSDGSFEGAAAGKSGRVKFDFKIQARETLQNVIDVLSEAGADKSELAEVTVYLTRDQDYDVFNEVYSEYFAAQGPARSTVVVKKLPHEHQLIMISAIAYHPLG